MQEGMNECIMRMRKYIEELGNPNKTLRKVHEFVSKN